MPVGMGTTFMLTIVLKFEINTSKYMSMLRK